jgi:hypothetical protein
MLYHIAGYNPSPGMGDAGFCIKLWPAWREAVAGRALTQKEVDTGIANLGRSWLDGHGYNAIFDPDNCGPDAENAPLGPNARPLYDVRSIRVSWGEWGPEHITVPGNACGLDKALNGFGAPRGGHILVPHNVDSVRQASLLLTVFLFFADTLVSNLECKEYEAK